MNSVLSRSSSPLSKVELDRMFKLYTEHPWLLQRHEAVTELFGLCQNIEEQTLLSSLLSRFKRVSGAELSESLLSIKNKIVEGWSLKSENTIVVAANDGSESDSSEALLYHLKSAFGGENGWSPKKFINTLTAAAKENIVDGSDVVVVDSFVGTGRQIYRRISWLKEELSARKCKPRKVYLCTIARQTALKFDVKSLVDDYFAVFSLPKGISDHFDGQEKIDALSRMVRIESELKSKSGSSRLPSLGYGQCEALFTVDDWNASNNVFPILWWKWLQNGTKRNTILNRMGG